MMINLIASFALNQNSLWQSYLLLLLLLLLSLLLLLLLLFLHSRFPLPVKQHCCNNFFYVAPLLYVMQFVMFVGVINSTVMLHLNFGFRLPSRLS